MKTYKGHTFMDDCIHLHACRRCTAKAEAQGKRFVRDCNEKCTAYKSVGDIIGLIDTDGCDTVLYDEGGYRFFMYDYLCHLASAIESEVTA